jgi:hypothetical protein
MDILLSQTYRLAVLLAGGMRLRGNWKRWNRADSANNMNDGVTHVRHSPSTALSRH